MSEPSTEKTHISGAAKGVGGGTYVTYLCGGDLSPGPREECANSLHDYPLPLGYVDAGEVAKHRLYKRWSNTRCPDCGLYGWTPGMHICQDCAVTTPPVPTTGREADDA
jgi:hypothetical protein